MPGEMDFWDDLANQQQSEGPTFEDLPVGAWVLGATATAENGGAAPSVRGYDLKDGSGGKFYKFNVGLLAIGGDSRLDPAKHARRMCYFDAPIHKGERETHDGPLGGRFTGFLNAVFATGVAADEKDTKARARARWTTTLMRLKQIANGNPEIEGVPVQLEAYPTGKVDPQSGIPIYDTARFIAGLFVAHMRETATTVLFKTGQNKDQQGNVLGVRVSQLEEDTPANRQKRRIIPFPSDDASVAEASTPVLSTEF